MSEVATRPKIHIKIYAPFKTYFDDEADTLSARNRTGDFDVLAHHKNFITLLIPGDIVVRKQGQPDYILPITKGVLHVKADQATIFLDV